MRWPIRVPKTMQYNAVVIAGGAIVSTKLLTISWYARIMNVVNPIQYKRLGGACRAAQRCASIKLDSDISICEPSLNHCDSTPGTGPFRAKVARGTHSLRYRGDTDP